MSLQTSKLYQVLKDNANEKRLPIIDGSLFDALTEEHGREYFREVLAEYIETERPEFPLKQISHEDMRNTFIKLLEYRTMRNHHRCTAAARREMFSLHLTKIIY